MTAEHQCAIALARRQVQVRASNKIAPGGVGAVHPSLKKYGDRLRADTVCAAAECNIRMRKCTQMHTDKC